MIPSRVAIAALIGAAVLALAGCASESGPSATWHHAPGQGTAGRGGGDALNVSTADGPSDAALATAANPSPPSAPASSSTALDTVRTTTGTEAVALTFDDGPSSFTPQILTMLREHGVKATFCLVGVEVRAHHDLVQQIVREGHTLCNHTWRHDLNLGKKPAEQIRADLRATNDEIRRAVPDARIGYFRHPGGNFTPAAVAVADEFGMVSLGWQVDTKDWDVKRYGAQLTDHILQVVRQETKPGSIVLAHDAGGDRSCTMAAFRTLLPELKSRFTLAALP